MILRFCYTSDAKPLLLKVWALQVEPAEAQKPHPKCTKRAKVGLEKVIKGVWKAKVVTVGLY